MHTKIDLVPSSVSAGDGGAITCSSDSLRAPAEPVLPAAPAIPGFDPRTARHRSGQRIAREGARQAFRTAMLVVGDVIFTAAAAAAVFALAAPAGDLWSTFLPRLVIVAILGQASAGSYHPGRAHGNLNRVALGVFTAAGCFFALDRFYANMQLTAFTHVTAGVTVLVALTVWRGLIAGVIQRTYDKGLGRTRTLLIAEQQKAWETIERFRAADAPRTEILGHLVRERSSDPTALGDVRQLGRLIEELDVMQVVVAEHLGNEGFQYIVHTCFVHGVSVSFVPETLSTIPCRVTSRSILGWPLLDMEPPHLDRTQVLLKRAVDIVLASLLLPILSPVMLAVALAVRLDSPGPILFKQRRPGLGGRPFCMLKFRTMRADAEAVLSADPVLYQKFLEHDCKLPAGEDPRVSPLGSVLRATSLDELPQLINVLRGEMSLIGPRPVVGPELQHYGDSMPSVLAVRPGMTGFWQVAGRSSVVFPERAYMDLYYVTNWSLGLDFQILVRTLPAVLRRTGAF